MPSGTITCSCALWNVWSVCNKTDEVMQTLIDSDINLAFITETWLSDDTGNITSIIRSYGYQIFHTDRSSRGGGIAVIYRNIVCSNFTLPLHIHVSINSFEYHIVRMKKTSDENYCIISLYRKQEIPVSEFVEELDSLLDHVINTLTDVVLVLGDFNVHFDEMDKATKDVVNILTGYGLGPIIHEPTHKKGHTLDQIFCNINDFILPLQPTVCNDISLSDHFAIFFTLQLACDSNLSDKFNPVEIKTFRRLKQIDIEAFRLTVSQNLETWSSTNSLSNDFSDLCSSFKDTLKLSLDEHAPIYTKKVHSNSSSLPSWFDKEYIEERRKRRSLERKYKKNKTTFNKHMYSIQKNLCVKLVKQKRKAHTQALVDQCQGNQKQLFKTIPKLLGKQKEKILPDHKGNPKQLADDFNSFYIKKVENIRDGFEEIKSNIEVQLSSSMPLTESSTELHEFHPATKQEITEIINNMILKTSPADPVPASVLNHIISDMIPHILTLVNKSLSTGSVDGLKESVITPILKKHLDSSELKNYRPISNIEFLSKIIEKVVLRRLNYHMNANNLHTPEQFGYKKGHSTENVLLEIVDEVLIGFDKQTATLVILLDLSAAFDTVDLNKLMNILEKEIHIKGTALRWFHSFLFGRTQKVLIGNDFSDILITLFGVPQGSVLGPVLFNIYVRNLPKFIHSFGFLTSAYADDTNARIQFSLHFQYYNITQRIPELLRQLSSWMNEFFLKLNPDKTEVIIFSPKRCEKINGLILEDKSCIRFKHSVRLLGVDLDESLNFERHINELVSSCYYHIRNIGKMKYYLSSKDLQTFVHSVITSKFDYCNVVLFGINKSVIHKLQKVQNAAARLIYKLPKRSSISSVIRQLHWLRVDERIIFKMMVIVFKHFCCISPDNLHKVLDIDNAETRTLKLKHYTTKYGRRSFSYAAPRFWNRLPLALRTETCIETFKKQLKYNLFNNIGNIMGTINIYRT